MIYEIINPSDAITIEADEENVAIATVLLLGEGRAGLLNEKDETVVPVLCIASEEQTLEWLEERGLSDLSGYVEENLDAVILCLDTLVYGKIGDRRAVMDMFEGLSREEIGVKLDIWNDKHRSSMSDWSTAGRNMAKHLREGGSP